MIIAVYRGTKATTQPTTTRGGRGCGMIELFSLKEF